MSNETPKANNAAVNLYRVYNEELSRMHALMQAYLQLPKDDNSYRRNSSYSSYHNINPNEMGVIWKRITELQDILIACLQTHDPAIQAKVAELALTSSGEEDVKIAQFSTTDEIPF